MIYLTLILLLPVSGWAGSDYQLILQPGDTFETGDGCNTCTMQADGRTVHCTLVLCLPAQREQPSCYQRMRRAMANRDRLEYLQQLWASKWAMEADKKKRFEIWEHMRRDEALNEVKELWTTTMKDCVEAK